MATETGSGIRAKFSQVFGVWDVMPATRRRQAVVQLVLQCASNFVEIMVLGLIVPLVAMVNDPGLVQRSRMLRSAHHLSGAASTAEFTLWFGGGLLALLLFRALISIWANRRMRTLCTDIATEMGARVLERILHLPYLEHARTNSAELARLTTSDVDRATMQSLVIFFTVSSEAFAATTVLFGLVLVRPTIMLPLTLLLCAGAYMTYGYTKTRLARTGERMRHEQAVMNKWVLQSLGDIRYARLVGSENFFVSMVRTAWRRYAAASQASTTIQQSTRIYFETGALGGVVLMVMYFVGSGSGDEILTLLGLLAVATVQLIPSINRVINGFQILAHIRASSEGVVRTLQRQPMLQPPGSGHAIPFQRSIEFRDVTFTYPATAMAALSDVSFTIHHGEMVGIVGPSGAGKSTIIDILCGLIPPDSGQILVDGFDIQKDLRSWQRLIGYVPQTVYLLDDTIRANITYGIPEDEIDEEAVSRAVETAALGGFVAGLPNGLSTLVGERGVALSGGQRQRIAIARALYRNAPILVLDEATSALDSATEREITETLRNIYGKKTIIVIAHRLHTVMDSNCIFLMKNGQLEASGNFQELQSGSSLFRQIGALG